MRSRRISVLVVYKMYVPPQRLESLSVLLEICQLIDLLSYQICATLQDPERSSCLKPPGALQTITENICGNGVKEGNEECDCGSAEDCQIDPCCDGKTCKLTPGSICDDLNDDCCSKCQLKVSLETNKCKCYLTVDASLLGSR
jgi:hypothetical protein